MTTRTLFDIQEALCHALGVNLKDGHVCKVTLEIMADVLPKITIERELWADGKAMIVADHIATVVDIYQLEPKLEDRKP